MSDQLTKAEMMLAAHMLEIASDQFSNHGCNDFDMSPFMGDEEALMFVKRCHEWNGDPEVFDEDIAAVRKNPSQWLGDDTIMAWLSVRLEKAAEMFESRKKGGR